MPIDDIDIGAVYEVRVPFTNEDSVAVDPTTVIMRYRKPDGSRTTLTYGVDAEVIKESVGVYTVDLSIDQAGVWTYRWEGSGGAVTAADEETFTVKESRFS